MKRFLALLACSWAFGACESSGYIPYVPGPGFTQFMELSLELPDSTPVRVGQWVTVHATRESGPWVLLDSTMTERPKCREIAPITKEYEAAFKVNLRIEPEGRVSFNTPGPPTYERQIRFDQPGNYRVVAISPGCGGEYESNQVDVVVR